MGTGSLRQSVCCGSWTEGDVWVEGWGPPNVHTPLPRAAPNGHDTILLHADVAIGCARTRSGITAEPAAQPHPERHRSRIVTRPDRVGRAW
jgi:hypothetical protein